MNKYMKIIGVLLITMILFRGTLYRSMIKYNNVGSRSEIEITDEHLLQIIESKSSIRDIDLPSIIEVADDITNETLSFTTGQASYDPNDLMTSHKTNCIGYSSMFNAIVNHLIREYNLENKIEANHRIGQLEFFGYNIHVLFESSLFQDHDYNEIIDLESGESIFIDPTTSDYLWIRDVTQRDDK